MTVNLPSSQQAKVYVTYKPRNNKTSVYFVLVHGLSGNYSTFINNTYGISLQQLLSLDIPSSTIITYTYPNEMKKGNKLKSNPFETLNQRSRNFLHLLVPHISSKNDVIINDKSSPSNWSCQVCTFNNKVSAKECVICKCPQFEIDNEDEKKSNDNDISSIPIIFMGHSMGGLIIKSALEIASHPYGHSNIEIHDIYKRTKGVIFYATPHRGSSIANIYNKFKDLPYLGPSASIKNLTKNNEFLQNLKLTFNQIMANHPIYKFAKYNKKCILSFIEGQKQYGLYFLVDDESSVCGSINEKRIKLDYCHTDICKPEGFNDERYIQLTEFMKNELKINVIGYKNDIDVIRIPSHFNQLSYDNKYKTYLKYHNPNYALNVFSLLIFNDKIKKMYDKIISECKEMAKIDEQLYLISNHGGLNVDDEKQFNLLNLLIKTREKYNNIKSKTCNLFFSKSTNIHKVLMKLKEFDNYITKKNDNGLLMLMIGIRNICMDNYNTSKDKKLKEIFDGFKMIKTNYKTIHKEMEEMDKFKKKKGGINGYDILAGSLFAAGLVVLAPAIIVGTAGIMVYDTVNGKSDNNDKLKKKHIETVLDDNHFGIMFRVLYTYLMELKDIDRNQRIKQKNVCYKEILQLNYNLLQYEEICQKGIAKITNIKQNYN